MNKMEKLDTLGLNLDFNSAPLKNNVLKFDTVDINSPEKNENINLDKADKPDKQTKVEFAEQVDFGNKVDSTKQTPSVSFKLLSPKNLKGKSLTSRRSQSANEPVFETISIMKGGKLQNLDKLIFEEDEQPEQEQQKEILIESKTKKIIDKFKPEKKNLKSGSLLALLNFQVKTSPFLMCSNINICEVCYYIVLIK